jgi:hypothetical protein
MEVAIFPLENQATKYRHLRFDMFDFGLSRLSFWTSERFSRSPWFFYLGRCSKARSDCGREYFPDYKVLLPRRRFNAQVPIKKDFLEDLGTMEPKRRFRWAVEDEAGKRLSAKVKTWAKKLLFMER